MVKKVIIQTVRLEDVAYVNPRLTEKIDPSTLVSFVGMADLSADRAVTEAEDTRPYSEVAKGYTAFENGDLLVAKITPCFENGKIGQAKLSRRLGFGSTEFHVVRPHQGVVDDRFLMHFLRSSKFRAAGEMRMTGSGGQRRVPADYVKQAQVPLLPIEEQRRIATILDKVDGLRTKRHQALAQLDFLTRSIFHDMFADPISNPMGWPLVALGQIGTLDRGQSKHRPRNDPKLLGGPHPLIQTGDVANASGYIRKFSATYSDLGLKQSKKWPAGTLCITIAANIAKTAILEIDACFPDSVVGFKADAATVEYVRTWFSFLQKTLEAKAPESAQKNINLAILRILEVPIPPLEMRAQFADKVAAVEYLKAGHQAHLSELDALFASLQHRAFKGEL